MGWVFEQLTLILNTRILPSFSWHVGCGMYVCICNAINERRVHGAIADGAARLSEVFRKNGCRPQCGRCLAHMREVMQTHAAPSGAETGQRAHD